MRQPLIFDTSIWIDFINKKDTPAATLLQDYIMGDDPVLLIPIIIQEILQGIREDQVFDGLKELLPSFQILELPGYEAAVGAASLFRSLRKKGVTIRKSNDSLIAYYAIHYDIPVVHADRDFDQISQKSDLRVMKA